MYAQKRHWLDYDPIAVTVLVIGLGMIELLAMIIWPHWIKCIGQEEIAPRASRNMVARRTASHVQNPACSVGDSRDHPIDERFARLPLRLRPRGPVPEIEIAAVLVIATLIAAAHHAGVGAGTHRPPHRHHAHPCPAAHQDWAPSFSQRSICRKRWSHSVPCQPRPDCRYRIGRDQPAYVRGAKCEFRHRSLSGRPMSQMG